MKRAKKDPQPLETPCHQRSYQAHLQFRLISLRLSWIQRWEPFCFKLWLLVRFNFTPCNTVSWIDNGILRCLHCSVSSGYRFVAKHSHILFVRKINMCAVPIIRNGQRKAYSCILASLFILVIINLGASWQLLQDAMVSHDDTRNAMALELLYGQSRLADATEFLIVFVGDIPLVC